MPSILLCLWAITYSACLLHLSVHLHCHHLCSFSPHTQPLVCASTESSVLRRVCRADRPEFASHQAVAPVWPSREHPRVWGKEYQPDREREQPLLYKEAATSRPPPKNNTPSLPCLCQDPRSGDHGVRWCPHPWVCSSSTSGHAVAGLEAASCCLAHADAFLAAISAPHRPLTLNPCCGRKAFASLPC